MSEDEITEAADAAYGEQDLLASLHELGEDSYTEYHDGMNGWFGWSVSAGKNGADHILELDFKPDVDDDVEYNDLPVITERYYLVKADTR